jgi:hypothetical protein
VRGLAAIAADSFEVLSAGGPDRAVGIRICGRRLQSIWPVFHGFSGDKTPSWSSMVLPYSDMSLVEMAALVLLRSPAVPQQV